MSTPLPPGLPPQQLLPPGQAPLVQLHPSQMMLHHHPSGAIIPPLPGTVVPPPPPPPPPLPSNNNNNTAQKGNFHTVLITHIPPHLSNPRALREIAYPCGSTRGIFLVGHGHVVNSTHPATNPNIIGKAFLKLDELKLKKDKQDTQTNDDALILEGHGKGTNVEEAVALIRMATTHGANTITRILPMAVKGVKVWNCSSGAILRNVVMANFQLKQEMKEEDEKNQSEQEKEVNDEGNTEIDEKKQEPSEESKKNNPTEMEPETNTNTSEELGQDSSTLEKAPLTASTPPIMVSNPVTTILEQSYRKSSELPPMAKKLAEISTFFYNEYTTLNTPNPPSSSAPTPTNTATNTNTTSSDEPIEESSNEEDPSMSDNNATLKLDVNKVAAAAGGGAYDEEADPLNAPQVLEAVTKFKKVLEERDTILKQKRMEIVSEKLKHAMKQARTNMEERKKMREYQQPPLPPPLPPNPPPPPPPPGQGGEDGDVKESGKRMVSNLPAWMTKGSSTSLDNKRKLEMTNVDQDPTMKRKQRIDVTSVSEIRKANQDADKLQACKSFVQRNTSLVASLKKWISDKIVEYLGEEEETLIDFIINQTLSEDTKKSDMMEEMQQVLDEDAEGFVKDLYSKVLDLAESASS